MRTEIIRGMRGDWRRAEGAGKKDNDENHEMMKTI
jgi:hypothetical protein